MRDWIDLSPANQQFSFGALTTSPAESCATKSETIAGARNFLKGKLAASETGNFVSPKADTLADLYEAVLTDYRNNGWKPRPFTHN